MPLISAVGAIPQTYARDPRKLLQNAIPDYLQEESFQPNRDDQDLATYGFDPVGQAAPLAVPEDLPPQEQLQGGPPPNVPQLPGMPPRQRQQLAAEEPPPPAERRTPPPIGALPGDSPPILPPPAEQKSILEPRRFAKLPEASTPPSTISPQTPADVPITGQATQRFQQHLQDLSALAPPERPKVGAARRIIGGVLGGAIGEEISGEANYNRQLSDYEKKRKYYRDLIDEDLGMVEGTRKLMAPEIAEQQRQRRKAEAERMFPGDPVAQANYIDNKSLTYPKNPQQKSTVVKPGERLIDASTGKPLYEAPEAPEKPVEITLPNGGSGLVQRDAQTGKWELVFKPEGQRQQHETPFSAAYEAAVAANGNKPLSAQQVIDLQKQLHPPQAGEPLYPVFDPNTNSVTYTPRSKAAGQAAPRTLYDAQGNASIGGKSGVSTTAPPTISAEQQKELADTQSALDLYKDVDRLLKDKATQPEGPLWGRVRLFEVDQLGGMGATPKQIELAVTLQRLLSSQAFAQGGKQLTPTELEQFRRVTPAPSDTIAQALVKTQNAMRILQRNYQNRLKMMPGRQRKQIEGATGGTVQVTAPNGKTYNFPNQAAADEFKRKAGIAE